MKILLILLVFGQGDPFKDLQSRLALSADTNKVNLLDELCYQFRFIDQDSAIYYGEQAVALAREINYQRGLANSLSDLGVVYLDRSEFPTAKKFWLESLAIRRRMQNKTGMGGIYMKLGVIDFQTGKMDSATQKFLGALELFQLTHDTIAISQALNNVAAIYEHQNRLSEAQIYYLRSFDLAQKSDRARDMGVASINLANILYRKQDFDSAIIFSRRAVVYLKDDQNTRNFLATAYNNLSEYYLQKNYLDSSRNFVSQALGLRRELGDSVGIVSSLNNLSSVQIRVKDFSGAEKNLATALSIAQKKDLKIELSKIYKMLYTLYANDGRHEKALEAFVNYHDVNELLRNNEQAKQIAELNTKYETEQKEKQIALQQSALDRQSARIKVNLIIIASLLVVVVLLAIIFVLARNRTRRRQELLKREHELKLREAHINSSIQAQERERTRFAQDIHDGMGQLISSLRLIIGRVNADSSIEDRVSMVDKSKGILDEMQNEIRGIAFNLMPQTLIKSGLVPALKEMALRLNSAGKVNATVVAFDVTDRQQEIVEISLYRVVQEWVNNVLKHNNASRIEIQLVHHEDEMTLTIEDNGVGFDTSELSGGAGNGWRNIITRMNLIGGKVEIDSTLNRMGTTLVISVPTMEQKSAEVLKNTV